MGGVHTRRVGRSNVGPDGGQPQGGARQGPPQARSRSQRGLRAYLALRRADVLRESRQSSACRPPMPSSSMRYPNGVAAPLWRQAPAGGGVLPPRPAAHAGRPDRRPPAPPVLGAPHGLAAPARWRPAAAGAAPDTLPACPDGHGWPANHNAEYAGSRRAGYGGVMWRSPLCGERDLRNKVACPLRQHLAT